MPARNVPFFPLLLCCPTVTSNHGFMALCERLAGRFGRSAGQVVITDAARPSHTGTQKKEPVAISC